MLRSGVCEKEHRRSRDRMRASLYCHQHVSWCSASTIGDNRDVDCAAYFREGVNFIYALHANTIHVGQDDLASPSLLYISCKFRNYVAESQSIVHCDSDALRPELLRSL